MKRSKSSIPILILLVAASTVPAAYGQSNQPPPNFAKSSKASGTSAASEPSAVSGKQSETSVVNACSAAADELTESRRLIAALETENRALSARVETERNISSLLTKANEARAAESAALRDAIAAKDETIASKDAIIANRREMIEALKKKPRSSLKRITDILIGAAIFAVIK